MHWFWQKKPQKKKILPRIFRYTFFVIIIVILTPLVGLLLYIFPQTIESNHTPDMFGVSYEEVLFMSSDGVELSGWFIPSENGESDAPTLIFLHGYPAEKGDVLGFALGFHDAYNLLLFDFRALGDSGGRVSTLGYKEVRDVEGALMYMRQRGNGTVGLWGFSLGGATALRSAEQFEAIDAVAVDSSYADMRDMSHIVYRHIPVVGRLFGDIQMVWASVLFGVDARTISPVASLERVHHTPILISHTLEDKVIPFSQAEKLREVGKEKDNVFMWIHDSNQHGFLSVTYQDRVREFFDEVLLSE